MAGCVLAERWVSNGVSGLYTVWGPEDVNFDYDSSCTGRERVVMMPLDGAVGEFGLFRIEAGPPEPSVPPS